MPYEKPDGLLLSKPSKRRTKKSAFLRKLEAKQKETADAYTRIAEAAARAAEVAVVVATSAKTPVEQANKQRRVASLVAAYGRRRDK